MKINLSGGLLVGGLVVGGLVVVGGEYVNMDIDIQVIIFHHDNIRYRTCRTTVGMRALQLSVFKGVCLTRVQ
jgi:hypothetical protein